MISRTRTLLLVLLKFALPAAVIAWLLWRIEPEQWESLWQQPKRGGLLAAALLVALAAFSLSFARWWLLVRCQGIRLSVVDAFRLGAIGFLLSFVSAGSVGGDVFKAVFLARRSAGKRLEAVASVLVDRGVGLYGLLLVVTAALMWAAPPGEDAALRQLTRGTWILTAVGTLTLAALVLGGRSIDRVLRRIGRLRWIGPPVRRIAEPLRMFHTHRSAFAASVLMSLGVHAALTISIYLVARGLYEAPPSFGEHLIIAPLCFLASALPISPAGLGVMEAAMEWLYRVIPSVPTAASGTLVALVFEIVKIVLAGLGMLFYWTAGKEVRDSIAEIESSVEQEAEPAAHLPAGQPV